ncbi:MAG: DUF3305 domain-containing protein [Dehalococcoidia bacterium]|nr:DUF3305 domain-containing protein [Dehalococcoidia bacterium]
MPDFHTTSDSVALAVVMERLELDGPWGGERWEAKKVIPDEEPCGPVPREIYRDERRRQILFPGFVLRLDPVEAEGYYLNATSPQPRIFVLWRDDGEGARPDRLSASYHEGARWLDGGENVDGVALPGELLPWLLAFAAAAFGSIILSYDRSHGGLWYTLSGPFTRRQVLRVKATLGALFLMASLVVFAVLLYALNLGAGAGLPVHAFLRWLGCEALLQLACFVCGLMGATLVGQVYVAPLAGWLIGGLPLALSVYVQLLTGPNSANWVFTMTHLLEQFAPLYYTRGFPSGPSAMFFVCTGCWILVGYFGALQLFRAISLERMDNFFLFPGLWHWVVFGGCCFVGLVMVEESSVDEQVPAPEMLLKHAVFTVLLWLLVRWFIRWYRKKFLEVS